MKQFVLMRTFIRVIGLITSVISAIAAEPLRTLAEVQALSDDMAKSFLPVELEAVVLYADPYRGDTIIHDGTSSCFIFVPNPGNAPPGKERPKVGDRVFFQAFTQLRGITPHVESTDWKILGRAEIPKPLSLTAEEVFSSSHDAAWVEVPAVVIGVESGGLAYTLVVEVYGHVFKADIPMTSDAPQRAAALMQRPATMRAIFGSVYNTQRQTIGRHFFVPSFDDIRLIHPENVTTAHLPLLKVLELLGRNSSTKDLVRLEGVVTQVDEKGFYLRDASGSALVQCVLPEKMAPGARVQVEGYAAIAPFRPIFRATRVRSLASGSAPLAVPMNVHDEDTSLMHMEFVSLDAELIGTKVMEDEVILQCKTSGTTFDAILPAVADLPVFTNGDHLTLRGICELTTTHPLPRQEWVNGFRIRLANANAVLIQHHAPWWTTPRLLAALGLMTALAVFGASTTLFFRRVVQKQARFIGEKMSGEAVLDERDRMARDLHDTLEQQLVGVSLQLDGIDKIAQTDPSQISSRISLARRMLRHTRVEARRSVWDLRSKVLEEQGFVAALRSMIDGTAAEGPKLSLEIATAVISLPSGTDFHLLRIAQEAMTNAIKHARAKSIRISLREVDGSLVLCIEDDGIGFQLAPQESLMNTHFGILGMQSRVEKIGALLDIRSVLGQGCKITVTLSFHAHDEKSSASHSIGR